MGAHARRHLLRQPHDLAVDHVGIVDIAGEGLLVADALLRGVGHDIAIVTTPGKVVEPLARGLAERTDEGVDRCVGDIADSAQAERDEALLGALPHAPQCCHRQRMEEGDDRICGHDEQAVGLGLGGGEFGDELCGRDTDAAGDALLVVDACADELGDARRRAEPTGGAGDVEECLVKAERLDERRDGVKQCHDARAHLGVAVVAGLDDDGVGSDAAGTAHRHRGVHAHRARFVGR